MTSSPGGVEFRIDPPNIPVKAAIDNVKLAMRAVAEQQHRGVGKIHPPHRLAYGQAGHVGAHFGNDRWPFLPSLGKWCKHETLAPLATPKPLARRRMRVAQAPFV